MTPRRPYLLRAMYEWIVDNGEVPNVLVETDVPGVVVPTEYIRDGQVVLNISPVAVRDLVLGDEFVMCRGRFAGIDRELTLPLESIRAIYCRDSGEGLAFEDEYPVEAELSRVDEAEAQTGDAALSKQATPGKDEVAANAKPEASGKPSLKLV